MDGIVELSEKQYMDLTDKIERLKADVQNLCDENARLRADLQWLKEGRRPIQKDHFPPKDASRETER